MRRRYSVHALTPWQFDKHLCCTYPVDAITDCDAIVDPEKKDLDILVITIEVGLWNFVTQHPFDLPRNLTAQSPLGLPRNLTAQ